MSEREVLWRTMSALLASVWVLLPLNVGGAMFVLWQADGGWLRMMGVAMAMYALYLHFRLAFDRHIFQAFAAGMQPEQFDAFLMTWRLKRQASSRDDAARVRGAMAYLRGLWFISVVQMGYCCWL